MTCFSNSLKKRRAISQVMGSVVILGVVASVGSVVLFNGMNQINAFSYDLSFYDKPKNEAYREKMMFEHVRFETGSDPIILDANLNPFTWDDSTYRTSEYRISITTSKGNFFSTVASPYNT